MINCPKMAQLLSSKKTIKLLNKQQQKWTNDNQKDKFLTLIPFQKKEVKLQTQIFTWLILY